MPVHRTIKTYRDPLVYYAEATSYLDAMDYIDFVCDQGWQVLVPPFVTRVEQIPVQRLNQIHQEWVEQPVEWGFVLHKFHTEQPDS